MSVMDRDFTHAPPYYPNPDDVHCLECVLRMGFEYFFPDTPWSLDDLRALTRKVPGKYTWPMRVYIAVQALGYDVVIYDNYDYGALRKDPENYLLHEIGRQQAEKILSYTDMDALIRDLDEFASIYKCESPENYTLGGLRELLAGGYLAFVQVDDAVLHGIENNFISHAILVHGYDARGFIAHNPGGASHGGQIRNQYIADELLARAVTIDSRGKTRKMMAFRPGKGMISPEQEKK
jgi:hypothetical protein